MNPTALGLREAALFGFERFSAATERLRFFPDTIDSKSLGGLVAQMREKKAFARLPASRCDCGERDARPRHRCRTDHRRRDTRSGKPRTDRSNHAPETLGLPASGPGHAERRLPLKPSAPRWV
jgi:hypothetical protein